MKQFKFTEAAGSLIIGTFLFLFMSCGVPLVAA